MTTVSEVLRFVRPRAAGSASAAEWENAFAQVAERILHELVLYINGEPHKILEIEFYVTDDTEHPDPFPHRKERQRTSAEWYFHTVGTGYRGGNYKGIDITISDNAATTFAGILIRAVECINSGQIVQGCSRFVDYILRLSNASSIATLVADERFHHSCVDSSAGSLLFLEHDPQMLIRSLEPLQDMTQTVPEAARPCRSNVLATPRVGLSLRVNNNDNALDFVCRMYRFVSRPDVIVKGRVHAICALRFSDPRVWDDISIAAVVNCKAQIAAKYLADFDSGLSGIHDLQQFIGKKTLSVSAFCKFLGAAFAARTKRSKCMVPLVPDAFLKITVNEELEEAQQQQEQQQQHQGQPLKRRKFC